MLSLWSDPFIFFLRSNKFLLHFRCRSFPLSHIHSFARRLSFGLKGECKYIMQIVKTVRNLMTKILWKKNQEIEMEEKNLFSEAEDEEKKWKVISFKK